MLKIGRVYLIYNERNNYPITTNPGIFKSVEKRKFYLGEILGLKTKQDVNKLRKEIKNN